MNKNKEVIKKLNGMLKGIDMGYDTFKIYEEKVQDSNLKNEFSKILSTINSQKQVLISHIEQLDGDAKDSSGVVGEIANIFEKMKDVFMNTDEEVLHNAIKSIDMGIPKGEKIVASLNDIAADKSIVNTVNDMVSEYKLISDNLNKLNSTIKR